MSFDADAQAYITAVEAADTQPLPRSTRYAINDFVVGCKADSIWAPIKAACFLAGPRTLAGALTPLVGAAPTNVGGNFVSADYNSVTGLKGNAGNKALDTNRAGNADAQNNQHISVWLSEKDSVAGAYLASRDATAAGSTQLVARSGNVDADFLFVSQNAAVVRSNSVNRVGFIGLSRSAPSEFAHRLAGTTITAAGTSATPSAADYWVFNRANSSLPSDARIAWYSIGESIDLAALDARLATYMAAIATPTNSNFAAVHFFTFGY